MPLSRRSLLIASLGAVAGCSTVRTAARHQTDAAPVVTLPDGGGAPAPAPAGSGRIGALGMVGDSITAGSKDALTAALTAQGIAKLTIDAQIGRRIEVGSGKGGETLNGHQVLTNLIAVGAAPDVWVIALGTNDVGKYDESGYRTLVGSMLDLVPADAPLVWVDVCLLKSLDQSRTFNGVLRELMAARPHSVIASWFQVASNKANKVLSEDRLHPNEAGRVAFASLVSRAVAALA